MNVDEDDFSRNSIPSPIRIGNVSVWRGEQLRCPCSASTVRPVRLVDRMGIWLIHCWPVGYFVGWLLGLKNRPFLWTMEATANRSLVKGDDMLTHWAGTFWNCFFFSENDMRSGFSGFFVRFSSLGCVAI